MSVMINKVLNKGRGARWRLINEIEKQRSYWKRVPNILRTPYRSLVFTETAKLPLQVQWTWPQMSVLDQDQEWKTIQIDKYRIFWPSNYEHQALLGLYCEVFAPPGHNPHAYETRNVQIAPGDWVIDAGACEGFFTFYALERGAKVLMVEPVPQLAQALRMTFIEQIKVGNALLLEGALGYSSGESGIHVPRDEIYNSSMSLSCATRVKVYSLDQIIEDQVIPQIDFIKMDVEGGEIEAIHGAEKVLRYQFPKLSIAVYHEFLNGVIINDFVKKTQPAYKVSWRGLFLRKEYGPPRPYILHAFTKR